MKRFLAILFLASHLFVISGLAVCFHYCGNTVSSVTLAYAKAEKTNTCPCKAKKMNGMCCHDAKIAAKITDTNKIPSYTYSFKIPVAKLLVTVPNIFAFNKAFVSTTRVNTLFANAPPNRLSNNLFLLNSTFRI